MPHLICSRDLLSPRPLPPSSHQLYWDLCSVLSNLACRLEFCGCFCCQGTLESRNCRGHLFASNPLLVPETGTPFLLPLPKVTPFQLYSSVRSSSQPAPVQGSSIRALVPPAIWNGPDSPSYSPSSLFVLSESGFPDDPLSPQEQRPYHAVLGCPLDPLFFGCLECVRHPRYDKAASFAPLLLATGLSHLSLCLQQTHRDTTDLETCSFELKIAS